jgi:hypothetical protein
MSSSDLDQMDKEDDSMQKTKSHDVKDFKQSRRKLPIKEESDEFALNDSDELVIIALFHKSIGCGR